jgi:hypothetical protein
VWFVNASEALPRPVFPRIQGAAKPHLLDIIDVLTRIFYPIRIAKGRRKERNVLRDSILMGYKDRAV